MTDTTTATMVTTAEPVVTLVAVIITTTVVINNANSLVAIAGANMFVMNLATTIAGSVLMSHVTANNAAADMYLSTMKYSAADGFLSTTAKHAAQHAQSTIMLTVVLTQNAGYASRNVSIFLDTTTNMFVNQKVAVVKTAAATMLDAMLVTTTATATNFLIC